MKQIDNYIQEKLYVGHGFQVPDDIHSLSKKIYDKLKSELNKEGYKFTRFKDDEDNNDEHYITFKLNFSGKYDAKEMKALDKLVNRVIKEVNDPKKTNLYTSFIAWNSTYNTVLKLTVTDEQDIVEKLFIGKGYNSGVTHDEIIYRLNDLILDKFPEVEGKYEIEPREIGNTEIAVGVIFKKSIGEDKYRDILKLLREQFRKDNSRFEDFSITQYKKYDIEVYKYKFGANIKK